MTGSGTSGNTYQNGVVGAVKTTNPVILFFENVLGVAERRANQTGDPGTPLIEASPGMSNLELEMKMGGRFGGFR